MSKEAYLKELGIRVRNLRIKKGLSQEELASKVGYKSRSSINKIELGINDIPQRKIKSLADALGVSASELLGLNDTDENEGYYTDRETAKIAQTLKDNPDMNILFDAAQNLSPDEIRSVAQMIQLMIAHERGGNADDN